MGINVNGSGASGNGNGGSSNGSGGSRRSNGGRSNGNSGSTAIMCQGPCFGQMMLMMTCVNGILGNIQGYSPGLMQGVQAVFQHVKGVVSATSGYAGGTVSSPSYEQVSTGTTGHAESVRVVFDTSQVSLG